eukprot:5556834-Amphidinium_carterae.1
MQAFACVTPRFLLAWPKNLGNPQEGGGSVFEATKRQTVSVAVTETRRRFLSQMCNKLAHSLGFLRPQDACRALQALDRTLNPVIMPTEIMTDSKAPEYRRVLVWNRSCIGTSAAETTK